ncbi:hypothetical protein BDV97DRAFT_107372 [Delphinella strobiligena]|nr:hypothetical protein BDV97DRAFT_107372 [Delphinella strobiligena]
MDRIPIESTRPSTETERRALLSPTTPSTASFKQSSPSHPTDGDETPRATSPAPSWRSASTATTLATRRSSVATTATTSYKGFPSEAAYLRALEAWAEEKKYIQPSDESHTLSGWYGTKTMDDYIEGQDKPPELGLRKKWKARKEERARRKSTAA